MDPKYATPSHGKIQVGYNVDEESAKINDQRDTITRKKPFHVGVYYSKMVKKDASAKIEIMDIKNQNVVFEKRWQDTYGTSGKITKVNPKNWKAGNYRIQMFRKDKLITSRVIKVK
jgi:hypothetical protein